MRLVSQAQRQRQSRHARTFGKGPDARLRPWPQPLLLPYDRNARPPCPRSTFLHPDVPKGSHYAYRALELLGLLPVFWPEFWDGGDPGVRRPFLQHLLANVEARALSDAGDEGDGESREGGTQD